MADFQAIVRSLIGPTLEAPQSDKELRRKLFGNIGSNVRGKVQDASEEAKFNAKQMWRNATGRLLSPQATQNEIDPSRVTPSPRNLPTLTPSPTPAHAEEIVSPEPEPTAPPEPTPTEEPQQSGFTARNPAVEQLPQDERVQEALSAINQAAEATGVPQSLLEDIAMQESTMGLGQATNPDPNSTASGLFQFTAPTWTDVMRLYPELTNSLEDRFDPYKNAMAAALMIKGGHLNKWNASRPVWGQFYSGDELANFQ